MNHLRPYQSPLPVTLERIHFDQILNGDLGPEESLAARQWLQQGAPIHSDTTHDSSKYIIADVPPHCYDTRVWEEESAEEAEEKAEEKEGEAGTPKPVGMKSIQAIKASEPMLDVSKPIVPPSKSSHKSPSLLLNQGNNNSQGDGQSVPSAIQLIEETLGRDNGGRRTLTLHRQRQAPRVDSNTKTKSLNVIVSPAKRIVKEPKDPESALEQLTGGWSCQDTKLYAAVQESYPIQGPRLYISPYGTVMNTLQNALVVETAEQHHYAHRGGGIHRRTLLEAVRWLRTCSLTPPSNLPLGPIVGTTEAQYMVILERRKKILRDASLGGKEAGGMGPSRKRKRKSI